MKNIVFAFQNYLSLSLAILFLVSGLLFLNPRLATANTPDNPSATVTESFLRSTLDTYRQNTDDSLRKNLKTLQKTVNELSERLERISDPRTDGEIRPQLLKKITENRQELQSAAVSFTGLAERSLDLDGEIDRAVQDLVEAVKNRVHPQLSDSRESFTAIAATIAALAEDTARLRDEELPDTLVKVGERIKALNSAIITGNRALKAFAS